jgi:ribosome-associated protein
MITPPVPAAALEFRFVHASGPGGQHVNKASTAVELRVDLSLLSLPADVARRLRMQQRNRINRNGQLVIQAEQFRSQLANRKDAMERLHHILRTASIRPKKRIATKPSRSARKRRVDTKKKRGQTKQQRKKPSMD